jgi:UDP-N-acetyl-D-mannosaminuronate dehydrogenase
MIAWAQELERYCDKAGQDYSEITSFYDEIKFFPPVKYFPGVIGGHCVMPNIDLLLRFTESDMLEAVKASNVMKVARETKSKEADTVPEPAVERIAV